MRQINYIMIARGLTGDSEVMFFDTQDEAIMHYDRLVNPILKYCVENGLDSDDDCIVKVTGKPYALNGVRFDCGYDDGLDELLVDECNHYFEVGSINMNATHYVADFSDWVDSSTIEFFGNNDAVESFIERRNECIAIAKEYHNLDINHNDETTWRKQDGMTIYHERAQNDESEFYSGFDDPTCTVRLGEINSGTVKPKQREGLYADMFIPQ